MGNKAFLCCSDATFPYPVYVDPDRYQADDCLILCADYCLPLLWLGFFRNSDYQSVEFKTKDLDGKLQTFRYDSPIVEKQHGLDQLDMAVRTIDTVLGSSGSLVEHARVLGDYVKGKPGRYLSLMLNELLMLDDENREIYTNLPRLAFEVLEGKRHEDAVAIFEKLSTIMPDRHFFAPMGMQKRNDLAPEDYHNLFRLLGGGWYKPVPWDAY